jgi:hypothetical protein
MADAEPNAPGWGNPPADAGDSRPDADTVPRDELRKVVAERDAYKRKLRALQRRAEGDPGSDAADPSADVSPDPRTREVSLRRRLADQERTIARLLVDGEIAAVAARLGAHDPRAVVTLTRDLFQVRDGRAALSDAVEDAGLTRFDEGGRERTLADVVGEYLAKSDYLVRPAGSRGAGSRASGPTPSASLAGMTPERYALLTPAEKESVRRMAGVPGRGKVW